MEDERDRAAEDQRGGAEEAPEEGAAQCSGGVVAGRRAVGRDADCCQARRGAADREGADLHRPASPACGDALEQGPDQVRPERPHEHHTGAEVDTQTLKLLPA